MSVKHPPFDRSPLVYSLAALAGLAFLATKASGAAIPASSFVLAVEACLLGFSVFGAVHHAEVLALKLGEPLGSIVLTLAVTVIELALIISQMSAGKTGAEMIGRDAVFATAMIVLNGVVGLALLIGGMRHREQRFALDGATSALSVLGTLSAFSLILPNFTQAVPGPYYSKSQLAFVAFVSFILYCIFIFVQTVRHQDYFNIPDSSPTNTHMKPPGRVTAVSAILLPILLVTVVMLAKSLSPPVASVIASAGLPNSFLGVFIALVVLLPEGLAALRAAYHNDVQSSLNLALGSAIATIGLTIPSLAAYSIWNEEGLALGISNASTALLILTLFISSVTLATGRTTILQGAVHLVIFGVFFFLAAVP